MAKLKKFLKYMDDMVHVRIYEVFNLKEGEEKIDIVFAGPLYDIPWTLTEKKLIDPDRNEGIFPFEFCDTLGAIPEDWDTGLVEEKEFYKDRPGLCIFIKE